MFDNFSGFAVPPLRFSVFLRMMTGLSGDRFTDLPQQASPLDAAQDQVLACQRLRTGILRL
jgi:hypothetical protein